MYKMKNKKTSAVLWISIIVIIVIGVGIYFLFFHMSETRAKEVIKEDYNKNSIALCDRFYVSEDKCFDFSRCYIEKAVNAMPKNLLVQFAKDIRVGKSSALDSYSLINGKQIGEDCVSEILDIPDDVNERYKKIKSNSKDAENYLIIEDFHNLILENYDKWDLEYSEESYSASYSNQKGHQIKVWVHKFSSSNDAENHFEKEKESHLKLNRDGTSDDYLVDEMEVGNKKIILIKSKSIFDKSKWSYFLATWKSDQYVILLQDNFETGNEDAAFSTDGAKETLDSYIRKYPPQT